jgi:exonuclease III
MAWSLLSLNLNNIPTNRTFNIKIQFLLEEIDRYQPEVLLFQELFQSSKKRKLIALLQAKGYQYHSQDALSYRRGGLFFFSKFKVIRSDFTRFKTHGPFYSLTLTDRLVRNGYEKIYLTLPNEESVVIFNTHLCSRYLYSDREIKVNFLQSQELLDAILAEKAHFKGKIIVSGDFNFGEQSQAYQSFQTLEVYDPLFDRGIPTLDTANPSRPLYMRLLPIQSERVDFTFFIGFNSEEIVQQVVCIQPFKVKRRYLTISDHYGVFSRIDTAVF